MATATTTRGPSTRSTPSTARTSSRSSAQPDLTAHKPLRPFSVDHFRKWAGVLVLDSGEPWEVEDFQLAVAADIFAGFDEVWFVVPEGSGKTTFMGGFALYHGDYRESAYVPIGASSRDQAGIMFRQIAGFVHRTPSLDRRFRVYEGYRHVRCLRTHGLIEVKAADERTADGVIPTLPIIDELHRHRDLSLYRTWRGKLQKRAGQLLTISTAGEPGSEFEVARRGMLGKADELERDGFHVRAVRGRAVLHDWSVPGDANVEDLDVVKAANPLSTVTRADLAAKRASPAMSDAHWRRVVCNQAVRTGGQAIAAEEWARQPTDELLTGVQAWCGLDLGWKWDTTAAVPALVTVPADDGRSRRAVLGPAEIVTPPRDGTATPPGVVRDALRRVNARNPISVVVLDPNAGGEQLIEWIERPPLDPSDDRDLSEDERDLLDGLGAMVIPYSQSNEPQAVAYETFMEFIRADALAHPRQDELTEHVLNAVAKPVLNGRARFDRPRQTRHGPGQERRVIDALQAASMVVTAAVHGMPEPEPLDLSAFRIEML